jgi:glycosyltransferase involved in cell wall biosynthesis
VGRVPHSSLQALFRISSAHVYFSYPFVLSWSMLEAMACGALVLGSATAPVQEVLSHGQNGLLLPFHDSGALASSVAEVLKNPGDYNQLREAARCTVIEKFDLRTVCLPQQIAIIDAVAAENPGSTAMRRLDVCVPPMTSEKSLGPKIS